MPNRLLHSASLYLRKHAHNPIDWWEWSPEALHKAKAEDKPIFLSIGYSSCHWCTVMEGEAFSDPEIAAYMNAHFLPIKVDREERPDIDSIYMQSLQMMTGSGGWPLNSFLSPEDLIPFYAGTYFPVEPRYGRPGFLQVLQSVRRFYDEEKDKLATQKSRLLAALQEINHITPAETIPERLLWQGIPKLSGIVSRVTMGNQFPMMPYAQFVAQTGRFPQVQRDHWQRVEQRAMDLVLGGIFDHVGGGFHRYTVDPTWTVPHFEKMLYDNGQILEFLSDVWAMGFRDAAIQRAVTQTVAWLKREMTHPEGYFYAAQDADSFATPGDPEPEEGEFYVWRWSELESLLTAAQFRVCQKAFDLSPAGNFRERPGCIVLQRLTGGSLGPEVEGALEQLFSRRYGSASLETFPPALDAAMAKTHPWPGRIPPVTDTKLIVAWNSLMIAGLARAYQVFRDPQMLALAEGAARFLTTQQWNGEALYRLNYDGVVAVPAKAEDYAFLIRALLHLHQTQVTQDPEAANHWLNLAITIQAHFDQTLWDPEAGGYFMADPVQSQDLVIREKETQDNATPSANGIALQNLVRLAALTGDLKYLDRAETGLRTFATLMQNQPRSCPSLYGALDLYQHFCKVSALPQEQQALQQQYHPTTLFTADPLPPESVGMVCEGLKCLPPVAETWVLRQYLEKAETRGS